MDIDDEVALDALFQGLDWDSLRSVAAAVNTWADVVFPDRVAENSLSKLVMEEVPELLVARKRDEPLAEEWADCMILLLDLAVLWEIDPAAAIRHKMKKNAQRSWVRDDATGFYNHIEGQDHDEARRISETPAGVQRPAVDHSAGDTGTDCCGAPIPSVGPGDLFVRLADGWHSPQLLRAGVSVELGSCTRCGRNMDWGLAVKYQVPSRRNLAGDAEETEGTGVG